MKNCFYIALICVFAMSCSEDFFTNELEVELIEQEDLLNIIALIDGDEGLLSAEVSNTRVAGSDDPFRQLDDAIVEFYADDVLVSRLTANGEGQFVLPFVYDFSDGEGKYRLTVSHPDFPDTQAFIDRPEAIVLEDVFIDSDRRSIDDDVVTTVSFKDGTGENFYLLQAQGFSNTNGSNRVFLSSDFESFFTETGIGLLFDDRTFDETNAELLITISPSNLNRYDSIEFSLLSMDEALYNYLVTAEYASDNEDNPFAEPVLIPEDFENAVGFFGMYFTRSRIARVE